ncbi:phosphoribosylanthranilate isomerase [Olivibacter domesticus]|uniref:N-(5'-phosphoribosyl)anthranilate isomerase n=1 Tax=Olivibacter domesticus TaxID=407022 RepID=A0A1H7PM91_OLID1|nr:phosphoribosylanthranilate isomerase [Olivibacter domesticus]SEL36696.1 phosphoribosylanthranilate isomerase [Olivibacter domesticus]
MSLKLKVCGMKYPANIEDVAMLKPDYLGFIFYKSSKRYVDDLSPDFVKGIKNIKKVGVFVNEEFANIQKAVTDYDLNLIQLHGNENPAFVERVKKLGVEVIKAFGISQKFDWEQLIAYENLVDYYLFDTKSEDYGGSGESFDWSLLSKYVLNVPFFLSGGLSAENIEKARGLTDVRLHAIDVNSKFESSAGFKDVQLLKSILKK